MLGCQTEMLSQRPPPGNAGHHAVQFYRDTAQHCQAVSDFLADGLAAGQPVLAIVAPRHRNLIMADLQARRFSPQQLSPPALVVLDAGKALGRIAGAATPRLARLQALVQQVRRARHAAAPLPVRIYSEMEDLLCQRGDVALALQLDRLWDAVGSSAALSVLHGYAADALSDADRAALSARRTHVLDDN